MLSTISFRSMESFCHRSHRPAELRRQFTRLPNYWLRLPHWVHKHWDYWIRFFPYNVEKILLEVNPTGKLINTLPNSLHQVAYSSYSKLCFYFTQNVHKIVCVSNLVLKTSEARTSLIPVRNRQQCMSIASGTKDCKLSLLAITLVKQAKRFVEINSKIWHSSGVDPPGYEYLMLSNRFHQ